MGDVMTSKTIFTLLLTSTIALAVFSFSFVGCSRKTKVAQIGMACVFIAWIAFACFEGTS